MPIIAVSSAPPSRDGFYSTSNQFLMSGPKGFTEFRMLENNDLFVRVDLPGATRERIRYAIDSAKKGVIVEADAPKEHKHDSGGRKYSVVTGLICECCEIAAVAPFTADGVLRMILSKKKIEGTDEKPPITRSCPAHGDHDGSQHSGRCGTNPNDPIWSGRVLQPNPHVVDGPNTAFESKQLQNGGQYLRIDMPGVPKGLFKVVVQDGAVCVMGNAPAVGHDSGGRIYGGQVALLGSPGNVPGRKIKWVANNGVIRLIIPPL